ncbi:hypothetical protein KP79_PYT01849 [Mizuhopecten yessoensis]|uniref:Uncharacterized protein n=1 Tax=Mizuhopecten yessoensis TaxID=6573 RepID=A0A210Q4F2_MIZYE|nr:hypothetical protein KP79_PYT01849 [Mizuhopecten yessoensis]
MLNKVEKTDIGWFGTSSRGRKLQRFPKTHALQQLLVPLSPAGRANDIDTGFLLLPVRKFRSTIFSASNDASDVHSWNEFFAVMT